MDSDNNNQASTVSDLTELNLTEPSANESSTTESSLTALSSIKSDNVFSLFYKATEIEYQYPTDFERIVLKDLFEAVDNGQLDYASETAMVLLKAGCTDLRVSTIAIYSSNQWLTSTGLQELVTYSLTCLSAPPKTLVAPEVTIPFESFLDRQLAWLFRKIDRKIEHLALRQAKQLSQFLGQYNASSWGVLVTDINHLVQRLDEHFGEPEQQAIIALQKLLHTFSGLEFPETVKTDDLLASNEGLKRGGEIEGSQQVVTSLKTSQQIKEQVNQNSVNLNNGTPSFLLAELQQKLVCFQQLLTQPDYAKAAIVVNDVSQLIESFDPRQYFPELFKPFVQGQVKHMEALQQAQMALQHQDSQPLSELYHLDRQAFMDVVMGHEISESAEPDYGIANRPMWED